MEVRGVGSVNYKLRISPFVFHEAEPRFGARVL